MTRFNKNGNIVREKQQSNKIGEAEEYTETEYAYDRRGRVLWTKTNDGQRDIYAQFAYDKRGNVLKYVYGQTTLIDKLYGELPDSVTYVNYEYDRLGNVIKETDSLGNIKTAEYNYLGLATKETDKNGTVFTKDYDGYGNMTSISNDNNEYWRYSFTPYSQQISAVEGNDFSKSTVYSYDKLGNVSYERMYTGRYANQYTHDVNGNRKTMNVRGNTGGATYTFTAEYQYDILDRLTNVSFNNGEASVSYTYDDNGKVLTETVNGTVTEYMYNEAGLLTSQSTDGEKSYTMEYGLNGAKTRETADGMVTDYTYDKMGQLITENRNGVTNQYTYDSRGNRISAIINGENCTYTYDIANRLIYEDTGVLTNTYSYDNNGNMVCRLTGRYADATVSEEESISVFGNVESSANNTNNSEAVYYTYNKLNQLTNVQSDDGLNAQYTYSPDGRRLYKTINGETIYTHNDGDNVIAEVKPDGSVTKYYRGASLIASSNGESLSRYSYDPHGSVTMINGTDAYTYDAFGNQLTSANDTNPFRYCGEYFDTETGFIYLRNRYYNPSTGRFISEDPIKDGTNWYVYCGSDPVNRWDPSGLIPTPEEAAYMADHIYDYDENSSEQDKIIAGWKLITVYLGRQSMKMGVYIREGEDWQNPTEYAVVFKGTDNWLSSQAVNNVEAKISDNSADMWDAMNYSLAFVQKFGDKEITFVGHSKGGGEAIAAADYTDKNAITFNAANYNFSNYVSGKGKGKIDNYYVRGEILESTIGTATIGTTHWLHTKYTPDIKWYDSSKKAFQKWWDAAVGNHDIKTVIEVL